MNNINFRSSLNDVQNFLDRVNIALQNDANLIFIPNRKVEKENLQYTNGACMHTLGYEVNDVINEIRSLCVKHYYETLFDDKQRGTMPLFVFIKEIQRKQVYIKIKLKEIKESEKVICISFHFAEYDVYKMPYK